MSTRANDDVPDDDSAEIVGVAAIESYETEDGVVFYDAENPLAWVATARPVALDERA